ncbi:MAG: hypothetical protein R2685_12010 [Candidatus Nitrosocosmicus sp.]|nr:hypothetical protein [Candidatus Nitrosocosmicus sp.]
MSNNENNQIQDIKLQYIKETNKEIRKKALDVLATYGNKGIDPINDLIGSYTKEDDLKSHGLDLIKKIRESKI